MGFYRNWIEKPRRVVLLLVFLCIVITVYALSIPLGYLPHSSKKSILISLEYRGAFAQEIERTLVDPLENSLSGVAGITEISSVCEQNKARVIVTFSARTDLNAAFLAVRDIVYAVHESLPPDVQRPVILKSDPTGKPVFIAGFPIRDALSRTALKSLFENIEGSGEVEVAGSAESEIAIRFDPEKMSIAKVALPDLIQSVRQTNILGGFGRETGPSYLLDSRFRDVNELLDLMIFPGVRLQKLAAVKVRKRRDEIVGRVNGKERLILYVQPEGDANVLELCRRLERVSKSLPEAEILYNYGRLVRGALMQVLLAVGIGIICVVSLTFLFMHRFLPSLLISVNIPFSIIVALAFLRFAGEQLNILSLSGIAVGVGLVIDAGVIFIEEFFRHGCSYPIAISKSRGPILFTAATTGAVFLPLLFTPRALTDQFRALAFAIVASVAASCIFVFCFLPAFLHRSYPSRAILKGPSKKIRNRKTLRYLLSAMLFMNRFRWLLVACGVVLAGIVAVLSLDMTREGSGRLGLEQEVVRFSVEYPSGYTTEHVLNSTSEVEQQLLDFSGVEVVSSRFEPERASFFVKLTDSSHTDELVAAVEAKEDELAEAFLHFPDGTSETSSFSVVLSGMVPAELERLARQLAEQIQSLPQCRGVLFHFKDQLPWKQLHIDLHKAVRMGVAAEDLCSQMYWALSAPVLDKWSTGGNEMDIVLQAQTLEGSDRSISALLQLPCPNSTLPVESLVRVSEIPRVGRIFHLNRSRGVQISVLTQCKHRSAVLEGTQQILASFSFPPGYRAEFGPEVREQRLQARGLYVSFALAALLIFFILVFQFQRLDVSAIILLQIPGAFICPILVLKILSWSISPSVIVGLILTSGIVVNNGILVFTELEGIRFTVKEVYRAMQFKLRPMLISSLTTIAGIAPLLLAGRVNRGFLAPLSVTVATGITGSIGVLIVTLSIFSARR
jgi:HAE1 family hydrophobic/amphiphilic exporter-1